MKKALFLAVLAVLISAVSAYAQAKDYRLCDNDGHCAKFTVDGKLQTK